ncbi:MAG: hypothetical protein R3D62_17275 [Xanthobacteraceae bacterium]
MGRIEQSGCKPGQTPDPDQAAEPIQASDGLVALQQLILEHDDPARLLECLYWSKEPGLLECVRALLAAPADVRIVLQVFLAAAVAREQITASVDATGTLKLHSPEAATILTRFFRDYQSGAAPRHCC